MAIVVAGYFKRNLKVYERILLFVAAMLLILPEVISSIVGAVIGVAFLVFDAQAAKKEKAKLEASKTGETK